MSSRTIVLNDALYEYLLSVSLREPDVLCRLREETAKMPQHNMQISPEQGQFMALLVELTGARKCLEVGTFTGYSTLSLALALPEDGQIVACDISEEFTSRAKPYWQKAGVAGKIDLRLGPALETLDALIADGESGAFDFAFIDADKVNYQGYFQRALDLIRRGGLILVDNVLWSGAVVDPARDDEDTEAIRAFNQARAGDPRISLSLVPIGDGLTLARKR
ncbi:MAG TPA: methyltransferase domain-containing protein [Rhodospirillales bacterium]|jgi:caffeoyl-CoA O-methyltransferase|nr:methyltransferase domain-containing protein [Rhodospirillales bacterium]